MLLLNAPVIWMPRPLHAQCVEDAARWHPLETGGVLMGYWNERAAVVTALIAPGPNAVHETHNFEPDHEWQLNEIARRFDASDGRETYLGDWHTHPNAPTGRLSSTDRGVLRTIIDKPLAYTPRPIMMIFFGADAAWEVAGWVAERRRGFPWRRLHVSPMEFKRC